MHGCYTWSRGDHLRHLASPHLVPPCHVRSPTDLQWMATMHQIWTRYFAHPVYIIWVIKTVISVLPTEWKKATVTAIHKKGDRNMCNNYRPVSLTSVICKMLEAIIKDKLMEYFTVTTFCPPVSMAFDRHILV